MKISQILKLILALCFTGLLAIKFIAPLPLITYNAKYPFIQPALLEMLFTIYPVLLIGIIVCLWAAARIGKTLAFVSSLLFLSYHAKLLVSTNCALCAASGLVPALNISMQTILFSVIAGLSSFYFFWPETIIKGEHPKPAEKLVGKKSKPVYENQAQSAKVA